MIILLLNCHNVYANGSTSVTVATASTYTRTTIVITACNTTTTSTTCVIIIIIIINTIIIIIIIISCFLSLESIV